jgi:hypothetical protein
MKKISFLIAIVAVLFLNSTSELFAQTKIKGWNNNVVIAQDDSTLVSEGWIRSFDGVDENNKIIYKSYYSNPLIDTVKGTVMFHTVQVYTNKGGQLKYFYSNLGPKKPALISQCDFVVNIKTNKIAKIAVSVFYQDESLVPIFYIPLANVVSGLDDKYWNYDPKNPYVDFAEQLFNKNSLKKF